jgi:glycosyltransferase involved in cell wall biosynthesis
MDKVYRLYRLLLANYVLRRTKNIISNSDYIKSYLEQRGIRSTRIYNPYKLYSDNKEGISSNRSKELRLISINNGFSYLKNVKSLIIAFSRISNKLDVDLYLVGKDYALNGPCHIWCKERQIDGIKFLGELSQFQLEIELQKSDVLIHPSLEESFGNTILEGLSNNLICVGGSKSGAVPELLGYGKFGILTDVNYPKELQKSIEKLVTRKYKIDEVSLKRHIDQFSIDKISLQHLKYYKSILHQENEK